MEIDERPTEQYNDIGGLDKQIEELVEAVVLPITHKDRFEKIGIKPPKGFHFSKLCNNSYPLIYLREEVRWNDPKFNLFAV